MDLDYLFIKTLDDLATRVASVDPYVQLGASALLRKLLIDGDPLVHQMNRYAKVKLRFHICLPPRAIREGARPFVFTAQDGFDPETSRPGKETAFVDLDDLLGTVVLVSQGQVFTVRDTIVYCANIMGGVHVGKVTSPEEAILQFTNQAPAGGAPSLRQLQAIGRVVLKGLQPLRDCFPLGGS